MKFATGIALALIVLGCLIELRIRGMRALKAAGGQENSTKAEDPAKVFSGLRGLALERPRRELGIAEMQRSSQAWGVVMDWGLERGSATITAFADGSASVYLSSGGGYIGGRRTEAIRQAAIRAVGLAPECTAGASKGGPYALPASGQVIIRVRSDDGTCETAIAETELKAGSHPLLPLANAMQDVITQYRLHQQNESSH